MNGAGHKGGAYGFKVTSINKLVDTKSANGSDHTLLHFLAKTVAKYKADEKVGAEAFLDELVKPADAHKCTSSPSRLRRAIAESCFLEQRISLTSELSSPTSVRNRKPSPPNWINTSPPPTTSIPSTASRRKCSPSRNRPNIDWTSSAISLRMLEGNIRRRWLSTERSRRVLRVLVNSLGFLGLLSLLTRFVSIFPGLVCLLTIRES